MKTFIALLRAVNVGGSGKLPMAELRAMAEAEGFIDVRTYIQSGNLVFASSQEASAIKSALEKRLENYVGKPVGVILRTSKELAEICDANPFHEAEPKKVGVLFLNVPPPSDTLNTLKGQSDEVVVLGEKEVFIHFPSGMGRSKLRLPVMSVGTMRNINTVTKLLKLAQA